MRNRNRVRNARILWALGLVMLMAGCATTKPIPAPTPVAVKPTAAPAPLTKAQQEWLATARKAHDAGDAKTAENALGKLLKARPDLSDAQVDYALVLQKLGKTEDAIAAYQRALTLDPGSSTAANNLALLLRQQGQFQEARQLLQQAVEQHPDNPALRYNLGVLCELYLMDLPDALKQYQAYQKLLPKPDRKVAGWIADLERRAQ